MNVLRLRLSMLKNGSRTGNRSDPHNSRCSRMCATPVLSSGGVRSTMENVLLTSAASRCRYVAPLAACLSKNAVMFSASRRCVATTSNPENDAPTCRTLARSSRSAPRGTAAALGSAVEAAAGTAALLAAGDGEGNGDGDDGEDKEEAEDMQRVAFCSGVTVTALPAERPLCTGTRACPEPSRRDTTRRAERAAAWRSILAAAGRWQQPVTMTAASARTRRRNRSPLLPQHGCERAGKDPQLTKRAGCLDHATASLRFRRRRVFCCCFSCATWPRVRSLILYRLVVQCVRESGSWVTNSLQHLPVHVLSGPIQSFLPRRRRRGHPCLNLAEPCCVLLRQQQNGRRGRGVGGAARAIP
jgi:hypothetical protein